MGITEELRLTAAKIVNAGKFAVGSAVSQVGLQVYDIVGASSKGDEKKNDVVVEEMNNRRRQQQQARNEGGGGGEGEDHLKRLFDEPLNPHRKIFIRSRL